MHCSGHDRSTTIFNRCANRSGLVATLHREPAASSKVENVIVVAEAVQDTDLPRVSEQEARRLGRSVRAVGCSSRTPTDLDVSRVSRYEALTMVLIATGLSRRS